jgi:hypothetical protein
MISRSQVLIRAALSASVALPQSSSSGFAEEDANDAQLAGAKNSHNAFENSSSFVPLPKIHFEFAI